jgi:hypothetical protein
MEINDDIKILGDKQRIMNPSSKFQEAAKLFLFVPVQIGQHNQA